MLDQPPARADRRVELTEALADIVLADGIDALSLRPAAARLGTSDRMLLYYFGTKAALIAAVLTCVSERLAARLAGFVAAAPRDPAALVREAAALLTDPATAPFMTLWLEIVARAGRREAPFAGAARAIVEGWVAWIGARTAFPAGVDPRAGSLAMLAFLDGLSALDRLLPDGVEGAAALFALGSPLNRRSCGGRP